MKMDVIEVKEGNCSEQREPKKIGFPLKGHCLTREELEVSFRVAKALGLMNPNGKVLVTIDTETGEIII